MITFAETRKGATIYRRIARALNARRKPCVIMNTYGSNIWTHPSLLCLMQLSHVHILQSFDGNSGSLC